jgi:PAS domain S-box-containing protein
MRWPVVVTAQQTQLPPIPSSAESAADVGSFISQGTRNGVERIFSFRRIHDFPLYAVVGQSLESVLAESGNKTRLYLAAGSLSSLVVLLFAFLMLSKLKREERVESALSKSELRFRSLTELSSDMYWEQDDQYRFISSSGSGPDWIVKGRREAAGKRRWDFDYLNMTEADWAAHIALLDARKPFHDLELCRLDESGRKVWISVSGEPVFDASGAFNGYRGVGKDITERKRAAQLGALEHAVNRSLADAANATAAVQAAIRAICETEGWECGRYFHPDEKAGVMRFGVAWGVPSEAVDRYIAGSRDITYAPGVGLLGRVWQSGQPLWISDLLKDTRVSQPKLARDTGMHGAFVFPVISEGKAIGALAFNSREVRERDDRLMQAISVIGSQIGQFLQRKEREEELRRFRAGMDVSEDMIWLIDPVRMRVIDVNDTACRKLGYSREELLGMAPQDIISMSREELSSRSCAT